jgi:hypothetical protein
VSLVKDALQSVLLECGQILEDMERAREGESTIFTAPGQAARWAPADDDRSSFLYGRLLLSWLHRRVE